MCESLKDARGERRLDLAMIERRKSCFFVNQKKFKLYMKKEEKSRGMQRQKVGDNTDFILFYFFILGHDVGNKTRRGIFLLIL